MVEALRTDGRSATDGTAPYPSGPAPAAIEPILETHSLGVRAGVQTILRDIDLAVRPGQILGVIGPSGAGKSTLLKCLNRLIELESGLRVEGEIKLHGRSVWDASIDADELRSHIGILFQQPVVFPQSIYRNVLFGVRNLRLAPRRFWPDVAEKALRQAALWDEVKDRLRASAETLSIGQQQRLCLARTLATEPEIILMDEPTSALDPRGTRAIEDLILELGRELAIVLVTHDMNQAQRVCDHLACLCIRDGAGEILESACCADLFDNPQCRQVIDYLGQE